MHKQVSKRRKRAQLTFVYLVMTLAVLASVAVLVLVILGYRFNRYDGRVEQGGLVQFESQPAGASVKLDNAILANRTPSKVTATAGVHKVMMSLTGYTSWQKNVAVKPGGVLWLNYALLLPVKPQTSEVTNIPSLTSAVPSPDRRWVALTASPSDPTVLVVDTNAAAATVTKIPLWPDSYTAAPEGAAQSFSVMSWDHDSRHIIVKHIYGDHTEHLAVDTRGRRTVRNITTMLGVSASKVLYSYGDVNLVDVLTDTHEVRRGNLSERTLSGPLLTNVADVAQYDRSTLTYDTYPDTSGKRQIGYLTLGSAKPRVVRTAAADMNHTLKLRLGRYYNTNYMTVADGDTVQIYTGDLPTSDSSVALNWRQVAQFSVAGGAQYIGFSPDANRFVYAQRDAHLATYDLELLTVEHQQFMAAPAREIDWVNDYHVASTTGGSGVLRDFDGTNQQVFSAQNTFDAAPVLSENGDFLYYFVTKNGAVSLSRMAMRAV